MLLDGYDTAQICQNGHVVTDMAQSLPQCQERFCGKCGEPTLMECPHCRSRIRGRYDVFGIPRMLDYDRPSFCYACGRPYPWTDRALRAAEELIGQDGGLTPGEIGRFSVDLAEVVRDTPQATASASRVKSALGKVAAGTAAAVRDILIDLVSESVRKLIWPGG